MGRVREDLGDGCVDPLAPVADDGDGDLREVERRSKVADEEPPGLCGLGLGEAEGHGECLAGTFKGCRDEEDALVA